MELLQIKKLNTAIERVMNQEMAKIGLTYAQSSIIGYLLENKDKDICQKDLEISLGLTHPTVSSILTRMEKNNLIINTVLPNDHRYKKIILTTKALEVSRELNKVYSAVKVRLFQDISPAQRELTNITMKTMLKNIT